jgi:hypothetical protein
MKAVSFIQHLARLAPSHAELIERYGFTPDEAEANLMSYLCTKRDRPLSEPSGSDAVLELLRNWDMSTIEIGMVRFPDPPFERSGKLFIGCVEADPLVLLPRGDGIVVYELGSEEHLLWRVASNGSALLDALLIAARFLSNRYASRINDGDQEAARSAARECASAAGGEEFSDFYMMLLG